MLTLDGMVELRLPSGVQHETMLVMRGRGIRELQGSRRGNQIVHVKVEIPKTLTARCVLRLVVGWSYGFVLGGCILHRS